MKIKYSLLLIPFLIYPLSSRALEYEYVDSPPVYYGEHHAYHQRGHRMHRHFEDEDAFYYEDRPYRVRSRYYDLDGSPYATKEAPLPAHMQAQNEKVIIVDPIEHAWGAYSPEGKLVRWGIATAGADWCNDIDAPCRTRAGVFRIFSMGDESCYSKKFPVPYGGAPMPYCMYFNGGQALHGSHEVVYGNVSHGCVRLHVGDAKWLRYKFVEGPNQQNQFRGTKVVIREY